MQQQMRRLTQMWLRFNIALKRYLFIETPTYQKYWKQHSQDTQNALDTQRIMRNNEGKTYGLYPITPNI